MKSFYRCIPLFVIVLWACGCNNQICKNPFYVQLGFCNPNDKLYINIDGGAKEEEETIENGFIMTAQNRHYLLKEYCSAKDTVKVYFRVNDRYDTTFTINKNDLKGCILGVDKKYNINVIYDYKEGGLREFELK